MKVAQILFSGLGGQSSVVFSLIQADKNRDYDHGVLFYGIEPLIDQYKLKCNDLDINYDFINKKKGIDLISWFKVFKFLKQNKSDVVLLHSVSLIIPVFIYGFFYKKKIIAVEHTPIEVKRKIEHVFSFLTLFLASQIVFLTELSRTANLKKYKFFRKRKTTIIENGIDIDLFKIEDKKTDNKEYHLISMISRFSLQKDHKTLIDSIENIDNVRLLLAGSGDTFSNIKSYINSKKMSEKVILVGMLDESEIKELLISTDIYVHSSFGETLPTSILQAMSFELPVIGSDIEGINNLICDNETGLLFEQGNSKDLEFKIKILIDDLVLRKKLGKNARALVEEKYSNVQMFEKYKNLINSL